MTNSQTGQNRIESSERSPSQPAVSPDFLLPSKLSGPSMGNGVAVSDNRISTNSAESKGE